MDIFQSKQSIKINCISHPNNIIQFIQINDIKQDKKVFYCNYCLNDEEEFNFKNYANIEIIENINESQVIDKLPPLLDKSIYKKIKECNQQKIEISNLTSKIENFFDNMKSEILQKIESVKKIMINNSESFLNDSSNIQQKYQELSQLNILQQILFESNIDTQKKENKLREFIGELESQKQKNSEILEQIIQQQQSYYNLIDFETPNSIKSTIIELIDKINIFSLDKNIFDSINVNKQNNLTVNSQLIFDLISTKSNYCSEKFLLSIKSLLCQINPLIEKNSFEEIFIKDKKPIDFTLLNHQQLEILSELSQNFIILSKEPEKQMNR